VRYEISQTMSPVPFASKIRGHVPPAPMGAPPMRLDLIDDAMDVNGLYLRPDLYSRLLLFKYLHCSFSRNVINRTTFKRPILLKF